MTVLSRVAGRHRGWPLDRLESLPEGPVLGTHFHSREIEKGLPERASDEKLEFTSVQPDPAGVAAIIGRPDGPVRKVVLCERDSVCGRNVGQDLRRYAHREIEVTVVIPHQPSSLLKRVADDAIVVFSPGSWDALTTEERSTPGIHCLPVRIPTSQEPVIEAFLAKSEIRAVPAD